MQAPEALKVTEPKFSSFVMTSRTPLPHTAPFICTPPGTGSLLPYRQFLPWAGTADGYIVILHT